jgi:hypothetical protein
MRVNPTLKKSILICSKRLVVVTLTKEQLLSIYECNEEITGTLDCVVTNPLIQIPWIDFASSKLLTQLRT